MNSLADSSNSEFNKLIRGRNNTPYYGAIFLVFATVFTTALFTKSERFADYDTYTFYIDSLVHFPSLDWLKLEPLSNIYLWVCYWLTLDVISTNNLAHVVLMIIFPILLWATFRPVTTSWAALLAVLGLFGPLLAFVTLRATPAYLLATWAVYEASARRPRSFVLLLLAFGFHFSSIMVAPPLFLLYFRDNLPKWTHFERPLTVLTIVGVTVGFGFAIANVLADAALNVIRHISFLSKYDAYSAAANVKVETSLNHYIFLVISFTMLMTFLVFARGAARRLNVYMFSSFLIYLTLFAAASPVAAFRQTPFWILPLIGAFPWERFVIRGPAALLFIVSCEAMFFFQVSGVYT